MISMIMALCPDHEELADYMNIDQIRALWPYWNCSCIIILDND